MQRISGRYILPAIVVIMATGCDFDKKEKCIQLDTTIGTINDSLAIQANAWGEELKIAVNTLDFTQLPPVRMQLQTYVDKKIELVKKMDNVGGSEKLLEAELKFLQTEKEIVENRFSAFEKFTDSVSMDELSAAMSYIQMGGETEQKQLEQLFKLREQYAEKNEIPKYIDKY